MKLRFFNAISRRSLGRAALLAVTGIGLFTPAMRAQSVIDWKSNAASTAWATGTNWVGDGAPANDLTSNLARFNQTSYTNQPNAGTRSIAGLVIGDGTTVTGALTIAATALTIGSGGITQSASTGSTALPTGVILGANQTWSIASGATLTASSTVISGAYSLEKTGAGTLLLGSGTSTYSGFTLTDGTVRVNADTAFGAGSVAFNGGVISTTGASARSVGNAISLGGNVQFGDTGFSGTVNYNGLLTVEGNRQISLVNTGGVLAGGVSLNGNLTVDSQIATQIGGSTIGSVIADGSGSHGLTKTGSGILVLSGANTFSGGTTINAGQVWAGSTTALGTGNVTLGGGTLDLRGQNLIVNALGGSTGTLTDTASNGTRTLTVGQGDHSGSFGGTVVQATSGKVIAVSKAGTGTQTFTGNNTYIGQTTISQGTLLINGTHVDASASTGAVNGYGSTTTGHFQVENAAVLGGTGRIAGSTGTASSNLVLVKSGGFLAPGDGIGQLTLDGASFGGTGSRVLNLASGAKMQFQLAGNGSSADQLIFWNYVSGDVLLNGNAIDFSLSGSLVAGTYTLDLIQFFSNSGTTAVASGISSGLVVGSLGAEIQSATLNYDTNAISLTYTVIPEPRTTLLMGAALGLILLFRRRSRVCSADR